MVFAGVDPIHEPIPVRPGAHYHMGGVDTDLWGATSLEGLYAAERGRVRVGSRGQPARRKRAHGDDHVRETRRRGRCGVRADAYDRDRSGDHGLRCRARARPAARPHGRRAPARHPRRNGHDDARGFGVFRREDQMRRQGEIIDSLGSATAASSSRTKGRSSTTTSRRRSSSASCSSWPPAWSSRSGAAESHGAHARPHDYPDRDDDTSSSIRSCPGRTTDRDSPGSRPHDQMAARGKEVLVSRTTALGRSSRSRWPRSGSPAVDPEGCGRGAVSASGGGGSCHQDGQRGQRTRHLHGGP